MQCIPLVLTSDGIIDLAESRSREFGNQIENIQRITISQLDALGEQSGIAQDLKHAITSIEKWRSNREDVVICGIDLSSETLLGFLKYGYRNLYLYTKSGAVHQVERTLCLLDFFVNNDQQRQGLGKALFDTFLSCTGMIPTAVAYDRPSRKLLPFLSRHYGLSGGDLQPNRFLVFPEFFDIHGLASTTARRKR